MKIDGKFSCDGEKIFNTVSGEVVPEDEPRFFLRGRDHHALEAIEAYQVACTEDCNALHMAAIGQNLSNFRRFAAEHTERMKQPGITKHVKLEPSPAELVERYQQREAKVQRVIEAAQYVRQFVLSRGFGHELDAALAALEEK